MNSFVDIYF